MIFKCSIQIIRIRLDTTLDMIHTVQKRVNSRPVTAIFRIIYLQGRPLLAPGNLDLGKFLTSALTDKSYCA